MIPVMVSTEKMRNIMGLKPCPSVYIKIVILVRYSQS